jgi:hypothetical protein
MSARETARDVLTGAAAMLRRSHRRDSREARAAVIAALFVEEGPRGVYQGLPDVECWGVSRDARLYAGPHPVVAHPPCARWCRLAGLVEARWGHRRGDDGGCFESALRSVRTHGGVLEHPAYSDAWAAYDLPRPPRHGGWVRGFCGGWSTHVEQGRYGHAARKATWLYAYGTALPDLRWGSDLAAQHYAVVSWGQRRVLGGRGRPRSSKKAASRTPLAFRDELLAIARSARAQAA